MKDKKNLIITILSVVIVVLVAIIVVMFLSIINTKTNIKLDDNINVQKWLDEKETKVIYVYSSNNKKCKFCLNVSKYLRKSNIEYVSYDVENFSSSDYVQFLKQLNIDSSLFDYPALIYLKDGKMYANIINIDKIEVLKQFIDDYRL